MRKSTIYLSLVLLHGALLLFLLFVYPFLGETARRNAQEEKKKVIRALQLTDLCLFTEARYTRNLSQADLHSAFQDHPFSLELFPSGSLTQPPRHLWDVDNEVD